MKQPNIVVVGSMNMDIVVKTNRFPEGGETILGDEIHFIPGGKGANQAVALARLGAQVTMVGAVGLDSFGRTLMTAMADNGVNCDYIKITEQASTGTASITLTPDENNIVVVPGANAKLSANDVKQVETLIQAADAVLLQLEIPLETVEYAAQLAEKYGKIVILNPAPARPLPESLLKRVHVITPNRTELEALTEMTLGERPLEEAVDKLLESGVGCVVTTLGSEGSLWKRRDSSLQRQSAYRMEVVDTTGAGDAFNAGLAYDISAARGIGDAVAFAAKVSGLAVTKFGAQDGMPTMEEVQAYFHE
ncbi:ribokinase [Paenibacillus sp. 1011MAR3C5]|uniref:ribokinase n=1 Tax=Paenibacillus sp. 1011MAR3C5 TaxID=1675787 RepID=UPI000E6BA4BE|nr:ribokinase [Paenibacillus sp. 1011MAR3C5]RJE86087.1 ribokinase [Paenibacillus sp. 1011MAR3C5]